MIKEGSKEGASWAEKDEPKGFYELTIGRDAAGSWRLHKLDFMELPSRPMVELAIDPRIEHPNLSSYHQARVARLDPNAIVRLKCDSFAVGSIGEKLTAAFLPSVFPPSMNVEIAGYRQEARALTSKE